MDGMPDYGWAAALVALLTVVVAPIVAALARRRERREEAEHDAVERERAAGDATACGDPDLVSRRVRDRPARR